MEQEDQDTYFITEVASDSDEKPFTAGKIHNKLMERIDKPTVNSDETGNSAFQRLRKRRKIMKITIAEKKRLAKLVEKEPAVWDKNNELNLHGPALTAAWRRITKQMPGRDVSECKIIWKSLKDAVRYRKNKIARSGDGTDEYRDERYDYDMDWELGDCLSYLMDASIVRRPQRSLSMEFENSQPSKVRILSVDPTNIPTSANKPAATVCNDDSESESNLSCTASAQNKSQEDDPLFVESMVSMANSIRELANEMAQKQDRQEKSSMKFDYIWRNLDTFFQRLSPEDVDELNVKFIQMAYERVKHSKQS